MRYVEDRNVHRSDVAFFLGYANQSILQRPSVVGRARTLPSQDLHILVHSGRPYIEEIGASKTSSEPMSHHRQTLTAVRLRPSIAVPNQPFSASQHPTSPLCAGT
jgi:hypothetical protein